MPFVRHDYEKEVVSVSPRASVQEAAHLMAERRVGAVVAAEHGRPVGILTDRDVAVRVVAARLDPDATPVEQVMSRDLVVARGDSSDVAVLMSLKGVRRIPLVDADGRLTGLVALDDLLALHAHRLGCLASVLAHEQAHESEARVEAQHAFP